MTQGGFEDSGTTQPEPWYSRAGHDDGPDQAPEDDLDPDPAPEDDLDLLEPAWVASRRSNRLTVLLAGGIVAALAFGGGVLVQKHHDRALVAGAATSGAARVLARGGAAQGLATGPPAVDGSGGSGGFGGSGGSGAPVVVGTVVSVHADVLVVANFGGQKVTVRVPAGVPVTTSGLGGLRAGASVAVTGAKAPDGSVTATSVVSRKAG